MTVPRIEHKLTFSLERHRAVVDEEEGTVTVTIADLELRKMLPIIAASLAGLHPMALPARGDG